MQSQAMLTRGLNNALYLHCETVLLMMGKQKELGTEVNVNLALRGYSLRKNRSNC